MNPRDLEFLKNLRLENPLGAALAELVCDTTMRVWNGHYHVPEFSEHVAKAGTTVLIWTTSRFGDIGITDRLSGAFGYDARVDPECLVNYRWKEG